MNKKQLTDFIENYKAPVSPSPTEVLMLSLLRQFYKSTSFTDKPDNTNFSYGNFFTFFIQAAPAPKMFATPISLETGEPAATFCNMWKFENATTFKGTLLKDILLPDRIYVNKRYESFNEILAYMEEQEKAGKDIYIDPRYPDRHFDEEAILTISQHPLCPECYKIQPKEVSFPENLL